MDTKLVSFIMSVYNSNLCMLEKTIQSILNQKYTNFEFIVMVNSPENEKLCHFLETYEKIDKRIKVFKNKENLGLALSLNEACKIAQGEYLARMDADDICFSERIYRQIEYIESNSLDLVGTGVKFIDGNDNIISDMKFHYYSSSIIGRVLNYIDCIPHPTWLFKRTVFDTIEGYRDIDYCEDYDFLLRAKKSGFKIGLLSEELLYYRVSEQSLSQKKAAEQIISSWCISKHRNMIFELSPADIKLMVKEKLTSGAFAESFEQARKKIEQYSNSNVIIKMLILVQCAYISEAYRIILKKVAVSKFYRLASILKKDSI